MACLYYAEDDGAIAGAVKSIWRMKEYRRYSFRRFHPFEKPWKAAAGYGPDRLDPSRWERGRAVQLDPVQVAEASCNSDYCPGRDGRYRKGFSARADDYLTKPFALPVLHSRVLALLRRADGWQEREITCDFHALNTEKMTVTVRQEPVSLSRAEYEILKLLMMNKGRTITRELLLERIWDSSGSYVNDNTLTVAMKRLREKLGHPACLKTVRSFGYRMEDTL